jgi:hypothetical protein
MNPEHNTGMRLRSGIASCAVLALCLAFAPVLLSQLRYRPTELGPWRPWSFTAIASARQARGASADEVQAFQARLQELGAIVKRAPAVAQPMGFAAELWGNLDGYGPPVPGEPAGAAVPLAGSLSFGAFPLIEFMRNGRLMNEDMKGGETQLLRFTMNRIDRSIYTASTPGEWRSQEAEGFTEPKSGEATSGLDRINDLYVLARHDKPLWVPLSLEAALSPVIAERRAQFDNRRNTYAKAQAEFAEWQTPAARALRRADWQRAAKILPDGPEFLANAESSDREIEAMNRERLAPGGPDEQQVKEAERELREAEQVLAGLGPDQRRVPACYDRDSPALASRLRPRAGAPAACVPLVKPNWDYFDPKLPRSAPQVLMVEGFTRCLSAQSRTDTTRGGCVINRELLASMDWDAVRAWLAR